MSLSRTSKLLQYINYRMRITLVDQRQIIGRFMAFDRHMNLVLGDAEERRQLPPKKGVAPEDRISRRVLGLVILRGDEVADLTVEGPPPADATRAVKRQAPPGPGAGRAAGRGLPIGAPAVAPVGLAGAAPGYGAPAPGSMLPRPQFQAAPIIRPPGAPPPGFAPGAPPPGYGAPPPGYGRGGPPPGMPPPGFRPGVPPPGYGPPPPGARPPGP